MSVIFPGNYVAHLNAYRGQGVTALPGIEFYTVLGGCEVTAKASGGATYSLKILSPDMRADDKPRTDKPCVIPTGASVYRTGVTAVNLTGSGTDTLTVAGVTPAAVSTSASGVYPAAGGVTAFAGLGSITPEASDATITVVASDGFTITKAGDQAAILVEIDYFVDAPGPDASMVNLPYKVEAGQGT